MDKEQAFQWLHGDRVEYSGCRSAATAYEEYCQALEAENAALKEELTALEAHIAVNDTIKVQADNYLLLLPKLEMAEAIIAGDSALISGLKADLAAAQKVLAELAKQEPVAWLVDNANEGKLIFIAKEPAKRFAAKWGLTVIPLYPHPTPVPEGETIMSKCKEEFDAWYPQCSDDFKVEDVLPIWQAAWDARGNRCAAICRAHASTSSTLYSSEYMLNNCATTIEQENEK